MNRPGACSPDWLTGDQGVLDIVLERRARRSSPARRDDPHRVTLVIEGGGMRGVYLAGMVRALGLLGLRDSFDEVFAVSAGAFAGVGLLLGNVDHLVSVYAEELTTGEFVNWQRFLTGRGPLISLDFLIEEIMTRRRPTDFGALSAITPTLRPVATDLAMMTSVALTDLHTDEQWRTALRASATVPIVGGPPVELRGRRYLDGFASEALPLASAIAAGASHVLALVSRSPGEQLRTGHPVTHRLLRWPYDAVAPGLAALMAARPSSYADSLSMLSDPEHRHRGDARVLAIHPTRNVGVSSLTTDPTRLWRAGGAGEDAVRQAVAVAAARSPGARVC